MYGRFIVLSINSGCWVLTLSCPSILLFVLFPCLLSAVFCGKQKTTVSVLTGSQPYTLTVFTSTSDIKLKRWSWCKVSIHYPLVGLRGRFSQFKVRLLLLLLLLIIDLRVQCSITVYTWMKWSWCTAADLSWQQPVQRNLASPYLTVEGGVVHLPIGCHLLPLSVTGCQIVPHGGSWCLSICSNVRCPEQQLWLSNMFLSQWCTKPSSQKAFLTRGWCCETVTVRSGLGILCI